MTIISILNNTTRHLHDSLDLKIQKLEQALHHKDFAAFVDAHQELEPYEDALFRFSPLNASKRTKIGGVCEKAFFEYIQSDLKANAIQLEFVGETDIMFFYQDVKVATLYCGDSLVRFHSLALLDSLIRIPETIRDIEEKLQVQDKKKKLFPFGSDSASLTKQETESLQQRLEQHEKRLHLAMEQEDILRESVTVIPKVFNTFNIPITNYG